MGNKIRITHHHQGIAVVGFFVGSIFKLGHYPAARGWRSNLNQAEPQPQSEVADFNFHPEISMNIPCCQ